MPSNLITRTEIEIEGRTAPLVARVNRRAKRLILKVDPITGEIHVTAPSKRTLADAIAFAVERKSWIAGQLDDSLRAKPFADGSFTPLRGAAHRIVHDNSVRQPVRIIHNGTPSLHVSGEPTHLNRRLCDWMKKQARQDLSAQVDIHCQQLGVCRKAIRIRDTRSRWGSCTADGVLSFSWRLILAPPEILNYVAAHECAHLIHMDHSPAFWRCVKSLGVDARGAEDWFKANGVTLFAYGANMEQDQPVSSTAAAA